MGGLGYLILIGLARPVGASPRYITGLFITAISVCLKCVVEARAENYLSLKLSPNAQPLLHNLEQKGPEMPQP